MHVYLAFSWRNTYYPEVLQAIANGADVLLSLHNDLLKSETSCEERNVGLDRRALVDENFGFFKDILQQ